MPLTENELSSKTNPFRVGPLDGYSSDELNTLLLAVSLDYEWAKRVGDRDRMNILDIWSYRIRDAAKEARKNEILEEELYPVELYAGSSFRVTVHDQVTI